MNQKQIIRYIPLVHREVKKLMKNGVVYHEYDELVQIGAIGLIEAATRFDERLGRSFSKYAQIRIQGAILDELRKRDWVPRTVRQRAKKLSSCIELLQNKLQRTPTKKEICAYLEIEEDDFERFCFYGKITPLVSIDEGEYPIRERLLSEAMNPQEGLLNKEMIQELRDVLSTLEPKEQTIINQYYFEEQQMKVIAEQFHVSESRICQLHQKITKKIAKRFKRGTYPLDSYKS